MPGWPFPTGLAAALNLLANAALDRGDPRQALALYEGSLALYRSAADLRGASLVLSNLGVLAQDEGDDDRAANLLSESIRLKRSPGNRYGLADSLDGLGSLEKEISLLLRK